MSPSEKLEAGFDEVLAAIAEPLKARGYRKRRQDFTRRCDDGWVLVNVQRSQLNDGGELRFAVNLAATADVLREGDDDKPPKEYECALRVRLGGFRSIKPKTDTAKLAKSVRKAVEERGIPLLEDVSGAEALRDHWLARLDDDETPLDKLVTLLEHIGPEDRVDEVQAKLEKVMERNRAAAEAD